jgi:hypothetical protein
MPPRLFVVAHNRNHVSIYGDAARLLREGGHVVTFVVVEDHPDHAAAANAANALGFDVIETAALERTATARDLVLVGCDWGPKPFIAKINRMRGRGVGFLGAVEGARFAYPKHYERVDDLLVWGQSGLDTLPGRKHVVGSPAIERARKADRVQPERPHVLVNYKFTKGAMEQGPVWARTCAEAAKQIDPDYVLSAHPSNVADLAGLNVSHAPFGSLLEKTTLIITRSSTVIYEALAGRVSVIYYPIQDERRAEFGDSLGAFKTAESAEDVTRFVREHGANPAFNADAAEAFLTRHISFDPVRSSPQRMADFIAAKLAERNEIDPNRQPTLDIGRLWRWINPRG